MMEELLNNIYIMVLPSNILIKTEGGGIEFYSNQVVVDNSKSSIRNYSPQ
jgi:hypothetical protein